MDRPRQYVSSSIVVYDKRAVCCCRAREASWGAGCAPDHSLFEDLVSFPCARLLRSAGKEGFGKIFSQWSEQSVQVAVCMSSSRLPAFEQASTTESTRNQQR